MSGGEQTSLADRITSGWGLCLAIVVAASLLRAWTAPWGIYHPDSGLYLLLADAIKDGRLYIPQGPHTGLYQPGLSVVVALASVFVANAEIAGTLVSLLAGAVTIVLTYAIAREVGDARLGILSAGIVAAHPLAAHYSGLVLTESLFTAVLTAAFLLILRTGSSSSPARWGLIGAVAGMSYLVRIVGAGAMLWASLCAWRRSSRERRWRNLAAAWGGCLLFMAPYIGYLHQMTGQWVLTGQQGRALYIYRFADAREELDGRLSPDGLHTQDYALARETTVVNMVTDGFGSFIDNAWTNARRLYMRVAPDTFSPLPMIVLGVGIVVGLRPETEESKTALGMPAYVRMAGWWSAPTLVLHLFTGVDSRYLTPLLPVAAPLLAYGMVWSGARFHATRGPVVVGLIVAAIFLTEWTWTTPHHYTHMRPLRDAAEWIRDNAAGDAPKIMTRYPLVAWWADGEQVWVPREAPDAIIAFARRVGVDYIVVDSDAVLQHEPHMQPFLNGPDPPAGVTLVRWVEPPHEKRVVYIYQVESAP